MTQEFKDHIVQHPNRFKRVPVAGTTDQFDLIPTWVENPSEVVQLGTPIDRQLFQGITSQLADITINVKLFGAKGDGVTDDTTAIQNAIDAAPEGANLRFPPTNGEYLFGQINVDKQLTFSGYGAVMKPNSANSGFWLAQGVELQDIVFEGFKFVGDGTTALATNGCITNLSGTTARKTTLRDMHFKDVPIGIYINSESAGYNTEVSVERCKFENIVGGGLSTGLGVAFSGGGTYPLRATVINSVFDTCYRHSIYVSSGSHVTLIANHIINHRKNNYDGLFVSLSAMQISRCKNILAVNNIFEDCAESCIHLGGDDPIDTQNILIANNKFINSIRYDISVGSDQPTLYGMIRNVKITGNEFTRNNNLPSLFIQSAVGLSVSDNSFEVVGSVGDHYGLIFVYGFGSSDDYQFKNNKIKMATTGIARAFVLNTNIVTGTQKVAIVENSITAERKIHPTSGYTNPNLVMLNRREHAATTPPSGGTWQTGDIIYNADPSVGSRVGWIYSNAGVWESFGQVGHRTISGSPNNNYTPRFVGENVLDTFNKIWYKAVGTANTDWKVTS